MTQPADVVAAFAKAVASGQIEEALGYLSPDIVVNQNSRLPYSAVYKGLDGFGRLMEAMGAFWERFEAGGETSFVPAGENMVVIVGALAGKPRHIDETLSIPVIEHYWVENGKIAEISAYYVDRNLSIGQIGSK